MDEQSAKHWELFIKMQSGKADEMEVKELEKWKNASNENKASYQFFNNLWDKSVLQSDKGTFNAREDWGDILDGMDRDALRKAEVDKTSLIPMRYVLRAAAAIILLVSFVFIYQNFTKQTQAVSPEGITASTLGHERTDLLLDDGTRIWLNNNSKLTYPQFFVTNTREVYLSGEAYFDIAPDKDRPFIIQSGDASIRVLGTSFNVRAFENESQIKLWVVSGKVEFSSGKSGKSRKVKLEADEMVEYNKKEDTMYTSSSSDPNDIAWKTKAFVFNNTSLDHIIRVLNTAYNTECVIEEVDLSSERFTGKFDNKSLDNILEVITTSIDCSYSKKENQYHIYKN